MVVGLFTALLIYLDIVEKIGRIPPFTSLDFIPELTRPFLIVLLITSIFVVLCKKYRIPGLEWVLKNFEREEDREIFPGKGLFFALIAIITLSLIVKKEIVGASLLIVSIGDSLSHLIGSEFGKTTHPFSQEKMIEGNIIGALSSGAAACIFIDPIIAFVAAFSTMFIEGIEFGENFDKWFEDNLFIPFIAAGIIVLLENIFL